MIFFSLILVFHYLGHYNSRRPIQRDASEILLACCVALLVHAAVLFLLAWPTPRTSVLGLWGACAVSLIAVRLLVRRWLAAQDSWNPPAAIIGTGRNARDLAGAILNEPFPPYDIRAFIALGQDPDTKATMALDGKLRPIFGVAMDALTIARQFQRFHLIVAMELDELERSSVLLDRLAQIHDSVEVLLPLRGLPTGLPHQSRYSDSDVASLRLRLPQPRLRAYAKRSFDLAGSAMLLVFLAPVLGVVALAVAADGPRIIFAHERMGRFGQRFRCLKFRTMALDAEKRLQDILANDPIAAADWATDRKLRNDPRVTRIGRWLRRTSLDELPQLINVLRGEMSLVGPRPITLDEVVAYGNDQTWYLQTRPGVTGLWQISGRNDVDFKQRVHLDAWYVQNWTMLRDITILLMTVRVVLARRGAY